MNWTFDIISKGVCIYKNIFMTIFFKVSHQISHRDLITGSYHLGCNMNYSFYNYHNYGEFNDIILQIFLCQMKMLTISLFLQLWFVILPFVNTGNLNKEE